MIEKRRKAKKDYIAKKAIDVFLALGYKESSLQDIATKGKFSKAGIYHYFKSKDDLLFYILLQNTDNGLRALNECLTSARLQGLDPYSTFEEIIKTYADTILSHYKVSLLILRERHQLTGIKKKKLTDKERALFNIVKSNLVKVPDLNKKININLMCFQIMSTIHWMPYWFDMSGRLSKDEAINQTLEVIFKGILKPRSKERD